MSKKLSTKTFVMCLMDKSRFFLDENESKMVKAALKAGERYIEIGESIIASSQIIKIINGMENDEAERLRQGEFQCRYCDHWVPKGKICGYCR